MVGRQEGSREFFEELEQKRYGGDDFMRELVGFEKWQGKRVLEVGCGPGLDLAQFARSGASVFGLDLSLHSVALARMRLALDGLQGRLFQADAENLPFQDNAFDLVWSWGVLHHTPDTPRAAREMIRVCKKGGEVLVMLYHRHSLVAIQVWLRHGLLRGKPFLGLRRLLAEHMESPGTQAFTREEASALFSGLEEVHLKTLVTRYDLRIRRRWFLPRILHRMVPSRLGWFLIVRSRKGVT